MKQLNPFSTVFTNKQPIIKCWNEHTQNDLKMKEKKRISRQESSEQIKTSATHKHYMRYAEKHRSEKQQKTTSERRRRLTMLF